jgi:hypothetical protein
VQSTPTDSSIEKTKASPMKLDKLILENSSAAILAKAELNQKRKSEGFPLRFAANGSGLCDCALKTIAHLRSNTGCS